MAEKFVVRIGDDDVTFEIVREPDGAYVKREDWDDWRRVALERVGESGLYLLMVDNEPTELYLQRRRGGALATIGRHQWDMDVAPWRPGQKRVRTGPQQAGVVRLTAPMTGSIVEVRCAAGDEVEQGQVLLVMESMKMNNELRSPASGQVEAVGVVPGQKVKANDLLVAIRREEAQ
ncbi:MAG: biotin/lipoyl-binding protein [Dehalococcoidia bacterium]|nr:biotin/lipoyl-binding protein [Dehalococcoidia bacterium]